MLGISTSVLSGCGGAGSSAPTASNETTTKPQEAPKVESQQVVGEAPKLSVLVSEGKLPQLADRLPSEKDVMVETMDSIGTYGEAFNFTFGGKSSQWWYGKMTEEPLFRFREDGTIEPNVAKGYDVNADATVYTIYLREGMKWSDGVPFTADDVVFFYDEMCVKETFGRALWECFKAAGPNGEQSIATFKKIDDYTVEVHFEYSKPSFLENVAIDAKWLFAPAHWYKEILPEYIGEAAAEAKAKEMGYSDVAAMGNQTGYYYWNVPGRPTLRPWVITEDGANNDCDGEYFVMERNPYFWKVDEEGKQLPYIDELRFTKISDAQQSLLKVLDGTTDVIEVNYMDYDVLIENQAKAGYDLIEWDNVSWAATNAQLQLNQSVKDEKLRALFQNKDFREALSIAVDREEFAEIISDGFAKGKQASPVTASPGYSENWTNKWTEYNPQKAMTLLEGAGLVKGSNGYYNFADGSPFVLNLQTFTESDADKSAELIMKYFDEVGIKTTYKPVERSVLDNMTTSNDHEVVLAPVAPAGTVSIILRPYTVLPIRNYAPWYGAIGNWYASGGEEGVEPTGDLLKLTQLYTQLKTTVSTEKQNEIALEMLKLHEENVWVIGYMESLPTLIAKKSNIRNFKESSIYSDEFRGLGIAHLHKCYFE
jgi:peptide/nickel transport system substrate-binding protein